jgi:ABC-2 type transport system ATP-binding protein
LILDEPTVSLDLPNRRRIWHYLRLLREQARTTILLSTHLLEEAEDCDRVAFMKKGHLIASGAPSAMIADLGKEVIEIHSPTPEALAAELDDWFAEYRVDTSAVLCARPLRDDVSANVLKASCRAPISEVTYRPANLNDVFLWLNAPRP